MAGIKARNTLDSSISLVDFLLMRLLFMLSNLDNISCICITITYFQIQWHTFSYLVWQPTLQLHGYSAVSVASPATALWSFKYTFTQYMKLDPRLEFGKSPKVHMAPPWLLPLNTHIFAKYLLGYKITSKRLQIKCVTPIFIV